MFNTDAPVIDSYMAEAIRSFVELIEAKHEKRDQIAAEIADDYNRAKTSGIEPRALKEVIRLRRKDPATLRKQQVVVDLYLRAVGVDADSVRSAPDSFLTEDDNGFPSDLEEMFASPTTKT